MIFHESRNYLFVHIQKTGGTSISACLAGQFGGRFVAPAHLPLTCLAFTGPKPFIFAVVRNPWERLVSWFEMMRAKGVHNDFSRYVLQPRPDGKAPEFSDFIRRTAVIRETAQPESQWTGPSSLIYDPAQGYPKSLGFNQCDYLVDASGTLLCDRILRFDNLAAEFAELMADIHPGDVYSGLGHLNARSGGGDWRGHYQSGDDREWVARLYRKDVAQFGFRFDA